MALLAAGLAHSAHAMQLETFKLLTAGAGVFASDAFSVALGRGARVLKSVDREDVHAEIMNRTEKRATRALREMSINT